MTIYVNVGEIDMLWTLGFMDLGIIWLSINLACLYFFQQYFAVWNILGKLKLFYIYTASRVTSGNVSGSISQLVLKLFLRRFRFHKDFRCLVRYCTHQMSRNGLKFLPDNLPETVFRKRRKGYRSIEENKSFLPWRQGIYS